MYDAWKAYDDKAKQSVKRSALQVAFDYGTVPLDFHATLGAVMSLGGLGAAVAGATAAAVRYSSSGFSFSLFNETGQVAKAGDELSEAAVYMSKMSMQGDLFVSLTKGAGLTRVAAKASQLEILSNALEPLNILKGTAVANAALSGAAIIEVAFAIIQSVAIDQFIAIQSARPKLEAALALAQQPITVNDILAQPNGSDLLLYHWSKSMESDFVYNDPQTVGLAALAQQPAQSNGYRLPGAQ
jgi:hypothetical protein